MEASEPAITDHARQFIDDVLKINAEHGMRSVESKDAYDAAVADAARTCEQFSNIDQASP